MIQSTLLLDSSASMGLPCSELPPTKAIGLRPHLAAFVTTYLSASPLALLSLVRMRDATATTIAHFTNNAEILLDALETKYFMMPPSGMMSLENGLRLTGYNMQLDSTAPPPPPVVVSNTTTSRSGQYDDAPWPEVKVKAEGASSATKVPKEAEARMDRTDIECALRDAIREEEELERRVAIKSSGVKREREEASAATTEDKKTITTQSSGAIAQRRIIVVTGAVSVLDPTNIYAVIDALAAQNVICDVISLAGAPHILVELCRRTKGTFLCPLSGGGEQLRRQLQSCAQLKSRHRKGLEHRSNDRIQSADRNWQFGGVFGVHSQSGSSSGLVSIGFPVLLEEVKQIDGTEQQPHHETLNNDFMLGLPSQPLCPRCYSPIAIPSVCTTCGLLTCALPQIHKAFLTLDQSLGSDQSVSKARNGNQSVPNILPPSQYVTLREHLEAESGGQPTLLRTRCGCCGRVISPPSAKAAKEQARNPSERIHSGDEILVAACQCTGCGGIRCLECDDYIKGELKLCPTCVGC